MNHNSSNRVTGRRAEFPAGLFIMMYRVVLEFNSVDN